MTTKKKTNNKKTLRQTLPQISIHLKLTFSLMNKFEICKSSPKGQQRRRTFTSERMLSILMFICGENVSDFQSDIRFKYESIF